MELLKELNELKKVFLPWIGIWLLLSIFFFGFGFQKTELFNLTIYYPFPSFHSISAYFLGMAGEDLLPDGVQLITLNPLNAFLVLVIISLLLGFIISFPFFLYQLIRYLSPAFYQKEIKAAFKVLIPSSLLFIAGCLFAYFLIIPLTFKVLYSFAMVIEAEEFFYVIQFVTLVLGLMLVIGIMFLLPIFMTLLTRFGIIDGQFWKKNWRYAIFIFLVFSAIITPDGTGITMIMLSAPLCALYFLGSLVATHRRNSKSEIRWMRSRLPIGLHQKSEIRNTKSETMFKILMFK